MGRRLFVGNLNFKTTGEDLKELFAEAGNCEWATVMMDRATGKSRGFGFVEMSTDEEAQRAIEAMNGRDCQGRNLNVNEARERTPGGGGGGPRGGGYGGGFGGGPSPGGGFRSYDRPAGQGPRDDAPRFDNFGGGGFNDSGGFGGGFGSGGGGGRTFKPRKEGGSRRGLRAKKRSL